MSTEVYLEDSYLKEIDSLVDEVIDGKFIVLDKNIFYPQGGGQPFDLGKIINNNLDGSNSEFLVVSVKKRDGKVLIEVDKEGIYECGSVHCMLQWDRRYKLMRMHTAAHLLSAVINDSTGALITGNQLDIEKSRIDFSIEDCDKDKIESYIYKANEFISQDKIVKIYYLPSAEAFKIPSVVKLAGALPPNIPNLRIVEIDGVDIQADGGTHVNSLKEIGKIELRGIENKGIKNRRIYFKLLD